MFIKSIAFLFAGRDQFAINHQSGARIVAHIFNAKNDVFFHDMKLLINYHYRISQIRKNGAFSVSRFRSADNRIPIFKIRFAHVARQPSNAFILII